MWFVSKHDQSSRWRKRRKQRDKVAGETGSVGGGMVRKIPATRQARMSPNSRDPAYLPARFYLGWEHVEKNVPARMISGLVMVTANCFPHSRSRPAQSYHEIWCRAWRWDEGRRFHSRESACAMTRAVVGLETTSWAQKA